MSCGLLLPDGLGLRDPCERGEVDAAASLTEQQRDDLTRSAQTFLRYMQFDKVHLMLDMEKIVRPGEEDKEEVEAPSESTPEKVAATSES